jgi:hypothetical protein
MPLADDPVRPNGRVLLGGDGAPLARFIEGTRDGRRLADLLEPAPDTPLGTVTDGIFSELRGWKVAAPPGLGAALVDRGGQPTRHAHVLSRDLIRRPPEEAPDPPPGVTIGPLDRGAADLMARRRSAARGWPSCSAAPARPTAGRAGRCCSPESLR